MILAHCPCRITLFRYKQIRGVKVSVTLNLRKVKNRRGLNNMIRPMLCGEVTICKVLLGLYNIVYKTLIVILEVV